MAFVTISSSEIEVGDPIKKELFDKIKANEDDHESRLNDVESNANKVIVFDETIYNGSSAGSMTGLQYFKAINPFILTFAEIQIFEKGSLTGFLEIDIKKSTTTADTANFTSVFTTKPKITFATASDYDASTNQAYNAGLTSIAVDDWLRMDITILPGGGTLGKFRVIIYGEAS